jgi:hypothetical protein
MRQFKLFASCCHVDLQPSPGFRESRVGRIVADLEYDLDCGSDRSPFKILRDEEIPSVCENSESARQAAITDCDLAIVFFSGAFCASQRCLVELARLIEINKPLVLVDTEPAWLNDNADDVARLRERLKDIPLVQFWELDPNKGTVRFGFPLPDVDRVAHGKYDDAVQRVVASVKEQAVKSLWAGSRAEQTGHLRYTVFMACPTLDVKPDAARLTGAIESEGHSVLAFDPEFDVSHADSFSATMSKALAKCDIYVQLLGCRPGRAVPGTDLRLVRAQYEVAKNSGKSIYVWLSSDFDIDECNPEYAAFLREIHFSYHIGNYVEFDTYVRKKLNDLVVQRQFEDRRAARSRGADVRSLVAIDAARADRDLAEKIADALARYVDINNLDYDLNQKSLAEAVTQSNGVVLAYGESTEGQKRAQAHFSIIRRQKAEIMFKHLELAVGDGAPATAPPCPRGPNVHVITVADIVDPVAMFQFLERLGVHPAL